MATDANFRIAKLEFYIDNILQQSSNSPSSVYFSFWFNSTLYANGSSHILTVKAYGAAGNPPGVASVNVIVYNVLNAPASLVASTISSSQINLSWSDVSGETGFRIERSPDSVNWTQIATTGAGIISFQNLGLNASTTYYYRVRATNSIAGDSSPSNVAKATTQSVLPNMPSNLAASVVSSTQINLSWSDNSANESGFRIERSKDGISFTEIAAVGANTNTFSSTGLIKNTKYYYRVRAYNIAGNSPYSTTASATTYRR